MFVQKEKANSGKIDFKEKATALESFIKKNIPLANFMDFSIKELTQHSIKLTAPLKPNDNHYGTGFGGSITVLGMLAGWSLLHFRMKEENVESTLVIRKGKIKFLKPVRAEFDAVNNSLPEEVWNEFRDELVKRGKSELKIQSHIYSNGELSALYEGVYVAISKEK